MQHATQDASLISAEMAAIVGRRYAQRVSHPVAASDIRRWVAAVRYPHPPPTVDEDELTAPPDFNPFAWGPARTVATGEEIEVSDRDAALGAVEHRLGVRPPALAQALNGGVAADYTGVRIRPGDVVTAESSVASYSERTGRLGPMLMTELATTWTNQHGERLMTHRLTLIRYQPTVAPEPTDEGSRQ